MADRIVVMRDGRILQVGKPMELYERPADVFTARFIGSPTMNMVPAKAVAAAGGIALDHGLGGTPVALAGAGTLAAGQDLLVGVRPQDLVVLGADAPAPDLALEGKVSVVEPLGSETFVHVEIGERTLMASAPPKAAPAAGATVRLGAAVAGLHVFDAKTEKALWRA